VLTYADKDALTDWMGTDPPPNALLLLRSASILVSRATLTARYDVNASGHASDPDVIDALRDATCSQAALWIAASIDPAAGTTQPAATPVSSKSIGSASVSYDTSESASVTAMTARASAATQLSQEALLILADAGLITTTVRTWR
jgi:hypothetical protein